MKKIMWILLLPFLGMCACGGNSTVAGNPQYPSFNQLIGSYDLDTEFTQEQLDEFEVDLGSLDNNCEDDDDVSKTITAGSESGTVILHDFFDYSAETQTITANYNDQTGELSFGPVGDDENQITCSGQFVVFNGEILFGLDCVVEGTQAEQCGVSASQE